MARRILMYLVVVSALVLIAVGGVAAQGPDTTGVAPDGGGGRVDSSISYQGMLKEGGLPVTGSRDMTFRLYLDPGCITQTGADIEKPGVPVSGGFFTVYLDVPHATFNGRGLWLKAFVVGAGLGCQAILPVPYALSLRPGAAIESYETGPVLQVWNTGTGDGILGRTTSGYAGVYGHSDANYGVWGEGRYGVFGLTFAANGIGVRGRSGATSGVTYGVYGAAQSSSGYAGYFENTGGGVDIRAAGKGVEPWRVREAYLFWTDAPDYWEDITCCVETRIAALLRHASQVGAEPEKLAERIRQRAREAGERPGYTFAEAFKRFQF